MMAILGWFSFAIAAVVYVVAAIPMCVIHGAWHGLKGAWILADAAVSVIHPRL